MESHSTRKIRPSSVVTQRAGTNARARSPSREHSQATARANRPGYREIDDEQRRRPGGRRRVQPAERRHHRDEPVEGTPEIHRAGEEAKRERAPRPKAGQGDQQRREGYPSRCWMSEFRETQREERAGQQG